MVRMSETGPSSPLSAWSQKSEASWGPLAAMDTSPCCTGLRSWCAFRGAVHFMPSRELETRMSSASLESLPFSTQWASRVPSLRLTSPGISAGWRQNLLPVTIVRASDQAAPCRAAYRKVYPPPFVGSTQLKRALPSAATAQLGWMLPGTEGFGTATGLSACANPHADKASRRRRRELFIGRLQPILPAARLAGAGSSR